MLPIKKLFFITLLVVISFSSLIAQITDIKLGTNNLPITEVSFDYNGSTIVQTSGETSTNTATTLPVSLNYFKVDNGSSVTLLYPNDFGNIIRNNNFSTSVTGVGIYDKGAFINANNATTFEPALEEAVNSTDLMQFLYYDNTSNLPGGDDFDIYFAKGITESDYIVVGERNGNTYFTVTPLDANGNQIAGSEKVRFGKVGGPNSGNGTSKYDWDIGFAPTNQAGQSMVYTAISASLFNLGGAPIFGFRVDNNGEADVKFFGLSNNSFSDNPNNPEIGGIIGNVFNDNNALTDNTVNGNSVSSPDGTTLYAILYDTNTKLVIASQPIKSDGSYEFLDLYNSSDYAVSISTNQGVVGNNIPAQNLPSDWVYTGDNSSTTAGNDGLADGVQTLIAVGNTLVSTINFGVQKKPEAAPYTFGIANPDSGSSFVIGSTATSNLSGDDNEDGVLGSGNTFGITSLPTNNNQLFYDGTEITLGDDGINPPSTSNPYIINNYSPSLLEIRFTGDANQTETAFDYVSFDNAGFASSPATYELAYAALPVEWASFSVRKINQSGLIQFATASEQNNSHFLVQKSIDGEQFRVIGTIEGAGNSSVINEYSFTDPALNLGSNYYRIMQVDLDGQTSLTNVQSIDFETHQSTLVYPNPISANAPHVNLKYYSAEEQVSIKVYNSLGVELMRINNQNTAVWNFVNLDLNNLAPGNYFLRVGDRQKAVMFNISE